MPNSGRRKRRGARHPHDNARGRLVVQGGESRQARHLRVVGVQQAVGEGQQGRQGRCSTGRPGTGTGAAARATSAAGPGKAGRWDTRTRGPFPGSTCAAGSANHSSAEPGRRRAERARPRWRRRRERAPSAGGSGGQKSRRSGGADSHGATQTMRTGRGRPPEQGEQRRPQPEERRRRHHEQQVLHHMDLEQQGPANGSTGDARARSIAASPPRKRGEAGRRAQRRGSRRRSSSQPRR